MSAVDAALSFMLASYREPLPVSNDHAKVALVKAATKASKGETVSPGKTHSACTIPVPAKGSLDAVGYIVAMRRATDRDQRIQAIAAFIGYDFNGSYGTQEVQANMAARRVLCPIDASGPTRTEKRQATASLKGFVAGMPDGLKREVGNLMAREQAACEARLEHLKAATDKENEDHSCCMRHAMAHVEEERMIHIRKDLESYRF